jgi:hypothetical protein
MPLRYGWALRKTQLYQAGPCCQVLVAHICSWCMSLALLRLLEAWKVIVVNAKSEIVPLKAGQALRETSDDLR